MNKTKKQFKLRKMPIDYLWEGLVLTDNIYDYSGVVLLIPKGEVITSQKLDKLVKFESGSKHITTYEESYNRIMEGKDVPHEIRQKITEDQSGYTALRKDTDNILRMAHCCEKISDSEVESVVKGIADKFDDMSLKTIFQCIEVPRPMDEELQRHSVNVSFLNGLMGEWLNLSKEDIKILIMAGLLHDIGKTKISEEILNAPRRLMAEEFEIMKNHPVYSYELLGMEFDERVRLAARHHHEKVCGNGYPDRLTGSQISLFAKITSVSDVYDAMVSKRSYKESRMPFDILEQFNSQMFEGLDEELVAVFLNNMTAQFIGINVVMSDGSIGVVQYIPPNDIEHPVIQASELVKQADDNWYCIRIA